LLPEFVAAGVEEGVAGVEELSEAETLFEEVDSLFDSLFGFGLEYRSEYHPPPLKLTAGAEITRSKRPLQ